MITGSSKEELKDWLKTMIYNETFRKKISENQHLIDYREGNYTWQKYAERIVERIAQTLKSSF